MANVPFTNELLANLPKGSGNAAQISPYAKILEDFYKQKDKIAEYTTVIDNISRTTGAGSQTDRFRDVFHGLNRLPQIPELPIHKESQGLILFTRPELNLAYDNISREGARQLSHLMTQDPNTAMGAIKLALDPVTQRGGPIFNKAMDRESTRQIKSQLTDALNPYLTLLSNTCITMSPPPDIGINTYTSPEGVFREQWIMNDSIADQNGYYDITCTFANLQGNAVLMTFLIWIMYMGLLRVGPIVPHHHNRMCNRMDYFTRIERWKFDESGRRIEQWFHTGASMPKSISVGAAFGLNKLEPYEFENKEISIQFASVGAVYNDPIQLWEFNYRMLKWNRALNDGTRTKYFYKAPFADTALTNWKGYPLINLATREMEWWIPKDEYRDIIQGIYNTDDYLSQLEELTSQHKGRYYGV